MNRKDKARLFYFALVGTATIFTIIVMNHYVGNPIIPETIVKKTSFTRSVDVNKKDIFNTMADIQNYPKVLPENFVSVKIINQTNNTTYAEEEVEESGIKIKLLVKHIIIPYEKHRLEIVNGDARGTNVTEIYTEDNSSTRLTTNIEMNLRGILIPFGLLPEQNLAHAVNTVIDHFIEYTKNEARTHDQK